MRTLNVVVSRWFCGSIVVGSTLCATTTVLAVARVPASRPNEAAGTARIAPATRATATGRGDSLGGFIWARSLSLRQAAGGEEDETPASPRARQAHLNVVEGMITPTDLVYD